jgi:hypothetical protein
MDESLVSLLAVATGRIEKALELSRAFTRVAEDKTGAGAGQETAKQDLVE